MNRWLVVFVGAVALLAPSTAFPCGGFFCSGGVNNPPPVLQTGEKILFGFESGGEVTAHVQILYAGEPREFAWVVPVPAVPTLSVGSDQLFTLLDQNTQPSFRVTFTNTCPQPLSLGCGCGAPRALSIAGGANADAGSSEVTVISQQPVGPFETTVLSTTNPRAMQEWLQKNGFDVSSNTDQLVAPYVAKGDYFIALRLQSGKTAGDLQPIVIKYKSTEGPCVPIQLTAAAAQPDMGVAVFLLGNSRAVPKNYLHLKLNEARIDWQAGGNNYASVVSAAADEAGGRAFVTDYAGPNTPVKTQLAAALANYDREALKATTPREWVMAMRRSGFLGASQNVLALAQRCVPLPDAVSKNGVSGLRFYQAYELYETSVTQTTVEQPRCGGDFDALVVEPLRSSLAMMDRLPVLTRLYTSMSASEMTVDPIFVQNPDLPMVPLARNLDGELTCDNGRPTHVTYTTSEGHKYKVPWGQTLATAPALLKAEQMGERGEPAVTLDNSAQVKHLGDETVYGPAGCAAAGSSTLVLFGIVLFVVVSRRRPVRS